MQTYAVYVRVSTDKDEQISSVENQIDICRNWLERNGFHWDEESVYKDEGISGTVFMERPAIQLILEKAKQKKIEMVIFKSISRLARDLKDSLEIREVFTAYNVRIISIEEGYDSVKSGKNDMTFELWSLFAAQYSRTLSSSIGAAIAAKVRRGEHIGKIPYGYDRINQKLVVNEEEAAVVRQIYKWYNDGWGFKKITSELNQLGIKSKTKQNWQMTSVQRLVRNTIYKGTFILNQYTHVKIDGRKKQIQNPLEKWVIYPNHHPAIVTEAEWETANNPQTTSAKKRITPWNEFRGLAKCSECGSNMVIVQSYKKNKDGKRTEWKYVKCSTYRRTGKYGCVNHIPIRYEQLRTFIVELLIKKAETIQLTVHANLEGDYQKKEKKRIQQLKQLERQKKSLLDLLLEGLIDKREFEAKRQEIEITISKTVKEINKEQIPQYEMMTVREVFQLLERQNQDLYDVFQLLLNEIVIHPDGVVDVAYTFSDEQM